MSSPYLGEIITFAGNFVIRHYAFCDGQLLGINQNQALASLLGSMYGGDGRTSFALPDLRGRVMVSPETSPGTSIPWHQGMMAGKEAMTLQNHHMPPHNHTLNVSRASPDANTSENTYIGQGKQYASQTSMVKEMYAETVGTAGSNIAVSLMAPFLATNFMIAIDGIYPARS
ncbi:Phage Tail Collar Domain protein [Vibrio aerogenes CECT 7868]|uniref:Phage Tail Collar Domain protein n=1 Tax=Vibrio aerogenes CECT 7868 TaxID=1216006 RepID=A0A1M6BZV6_9VIBR|nr:tail fiber protein [Vibrio aerogenes]SHI54277.1 Phage Tail Collar Domain protein [Vibrio aerogenes CECT 7868]